MLKPGDTLNNGATVLAYSGNYMEGIVLAVFGPRTHPFVTWHTYFYPDNAVWNCAHGNYYQHLENAIQDFKSRCGDAVGIV